ncbi:diguanylate cyclase [Trinickia terrae]|uniref:Diguanylate cyclase n=1 Tax=Trinickia terrae TaxID=2571161 RepID=A0A4U1I3Y5_9BURK|nr:VOC family protein [Trinickia terrae]TKC87966.1 diguanylate cyclase [Trinickia terrae]
MSIQGFSHYNLRAARDVLDALKDFYIDVVGLELGHRPPFQHYGFWLYAGEQAVLHLSEAGPGEHRPANVANTFDHVAFSCTGVAEHEARLRAFDIPYTTGEVPATGQHQIFFADPAGNGVELNFETADR